MVNVFIDSSIFISANYNFGDSVFAALISLTKENSVKIIMPDIIRDEILEHIKQDSLKALNSVNKLKRDARVLRNLNKSPYKYFFKKHELNSITNSLIHIFNNFLKIASVEVLDTNKVDVHEVFRLYFDRLPPFGEAKKKNEFPDAFALLCVLDWANSKQEDVLVISLDLDHKEFCSKNNNLFYEEKLSSVIDALLSSTDEFLVKSTKDLLQKNEVELKRIIKEKFLDTMFYIADGEGDVHQINVEDVEITDEFFIEFDNFVTIIELEVLIQFYADVTYDDLESATYDNEDRILVPWRQIETTKNEEYELTFIIEFEHKIDEPDYFVINQISLKNYEDVGIGIYVHL